MPKVPEIQRETTQDPSSVYYIHPSGYTRMKLVSTVFNGTNFNEWKGAMLLGLTTKNKKVFIDGALAKPAVDSPTYQAWDRCNTMVIGWLIDVLDPKIGKSIINFSTAIEAWVDLEERFGQSSSAQLYAYNMKFLSFNKIICQLLSTTLN